MNLVNTILAEIRQSEVIRVEDSLILTKSMSMAYVEGFPTFSMIFRSGFVQSQPNLNGFTLLLDKASVAQRDGVCGYLIPTKQNSKGLFLSFMRVESLSQGNIENKKAA